MEPKAILNADPLDLLFDNRNKSYGAYTLRKYYDRRLLTGLALSLSAGIIFFSLLTLGPQPLLVRTIDLGGPDLAPAAPPVFEKKKIVIPARPVHTVHAASTVFNIPRIVPENDADKPMHTLAELEGKQTGNSELAGPPETGNVQTGPVNSRGNEMPAQAQESAPEVYKTADVMPQFPGGQQALMRFLTRNLRMPEGVEAGTKVSVLATFVVGVDGKVRQAEMNRSGGESFDAEVKRVLAKMPAWIPGRVTGRAVAVYFTLPVQFVVPEE